MPIKCPCGSNENYQQCCQPLHLGQVLAQSAEQLMRSRYAAFVTHEIDYLMITHSPETRDQLIKADIMQWAKDSQWLGLNVVKHHRSSGSAQVEFVAWYKVDGKLQAHHELSHFSLETIDPALTELVGLNTTQAWYYHSAKPCDSTINIPKRNDPCICASGKKFKKCCG